MNINSNILQQDSTRDNFIDVDSQESLIIINANSDFIIIVLI